MLELLGMLGWLYDLWILAVHELAHFCEIGLWIYAHYRDLIIIGDQVLFFSPENKIGFGEMLGGGDQNKVGIDLL